MANKWRCDVIITYIIWEMMSMGCSNWRQHLGNRKQYDGVIGGNTWVIGSDVMALLTTSSGK